MNKQITRCLIFTSVLLIILGANAQQQDNARLNQTVAGDSVNKDFPKKDCEQQALGDLFNKKKDKAPKTDKKFMALVLPNISSNPTNGFILGIGGT